MSAVKKAYKESLDYIIIIYYIIKYEMVLQQPLSANYHYNLSSRRLPAINAAAPNRRYPANYRKRHPHAHQISPTNGDANEYANSDNHTAIRRFLA